jgi:uncharacterized protein YbjQ (UPF0145 family)
MYDENDWISTILGTAILSTMFYFNEKKGRESAYKEIEEKKRNDEMEELKRQIKELKKKAC